MPAAGLVEVLEAAGRSAASTLSRAVTILSHGVTHEQSAPPYGCPTVAVRIDRAGEAKVPMDCVPSASFHQTIV
jgi:hypothetical protein